MNGKKLLLALVTTAAAAACVPSLAQERGYHNDAGNRYDARDQRSEGDRNRGDDRYQRGDDRNQRGDDRYQRGGDRYDRAQAWRRDEARDGRSAQGGWGRTSDFHSGYDGYGPNHNMHRGDRLPSRYRTHQYVVDNYRAHHLSAPPRGHHWVQVGADYVLVAAATGLIVNAVMGH
jgi:Ni/Co efflux regulator RcnB